MSTRSHTRNAKLPSCPQGFRLPPVGVPYIPKSAVEARRTRAYRHAKLLQELEALRPLPDDAEGPLPREPLRLRSQTR